jgi:two-component system cell cycle response regulator DivK
MTKTILIIDDNPNNRQLVGDILTFHGYEVLMACDGEIGIALAREMRPDLILMDIQMPVMDGFAALGLLRKDPRTRTSKVVALTALAMKGDRERILRAGFDGYLAKPIATRELPQWVASYLRGEAS